jgi:sortase A
MAILRQVQPAPSNVWGPLPPHVSRRRPSALLRWVERLLLVVGIAALGYYAYAYAETTLYQAFENRELDRILSSPPPAAMRGNVPVVTPKSRPRAANGSAIGRLEIPRLGVSVIIRTGSDARTLQLAVGHIPGTAFPGDDGNVGLAGHRDTFFRRLRDIRNDDEIRVTTSDGVFAYRVERTSVVKPKDVWVLRPTGYPALTLVTCYPFTYIGNAPERFIVRATRMK